MTLQVDQLYKGGVAAIRAGDRATAKANLTEVVRLDPTHEQAWLWLSAAVDTDEERITCLQNVLTLNPNSEAARRGLEKLGASLAIDVTPSGSSEEPSLTQPEPYREPPRRMEHAQSPVAESFSILAEREDEPSQPANLIQPGRAHHEQVKPEESWRTKLYEEGSQDAAPNSATFLRDNKEYHEPRSVLDLINVWGNLALFNAGEDFKAEAKYGGFGHIAVNIVTAGILQLLGAVVGIMLLVVMLQRGANLPFLNSLLQLAGPEAAAELDYFNANYIVWDTLNFTRVGMSMLVPGLIAIPAIFIGTMIESFVVDKISGWFKGRGDVVQTMHALTTVLVVQQMVQIPLLIALPFMTIWIAVLLFGGFGLYQFILKLIAVGKVQEYDLISSFGTLLISGFVMGFAWGIFGCFISFIGAAAGV